MLSPENKQRLKAYELPIMIWHNDKSISLDIIQREDILNIIRTVEPGYSVMFWCQSCVGKMLDKAYKLLYE